VTAPVVIDARERAARSWLPAVGLPGAIYQGPDGETLICQPDGSLEAWPPDGLKSCASSPTATRVVR